MRLRRVRGEKGGRGGVPRGAAAVLLLPERVGASGTARVAPPCVGCTHSCGMHLGGHNGSHPHSRPQRTDQLGTPLPRATRRQAPLHSRRPRWRCVALTARTRPARSPRRPRYTSLPPAWTPRCAQGVSACFVFEFHQWGFWLSQASLLAPRCNHGTQLCPAESAPVMLNYFSVRPPAPLSSDGTRTPPANSGSHLYPFLPPPAGPSPAPRAATAASRRASRGSSLAATAGPRL